MANVGNCLRCCCLMLPISWTISSFVLAIFILVGNTSKAPFPADTYFLRMNVSAIDPPITPTPGYTIAETLGLHDFYQTGLWNWCEGYYNLAENYRPMVTNCGPHDNQYSFDPIALMASELLPPYTIVFVQSEVNAIHTIQNTAGWLRAAFVITALFTGFTLVIGPMTGVWHQRKLFNCIPVGTMCFASFFWFLGAVTATNVYFKLRNAFNNDDRLQVEANMGHQMFAWVWLGVWTSSTAAGQWCCAAICCPGGHRKRRIEMRKPFAALPPIPWIGSHVDRPSSIVSTSAMMSNTDGIPIAPIGVVYPAPPPPAPGQHYGAIATGLAAAGGLALAEHYHHQHENQPQPPPPPPEHHHYGEALAAGGALAAGAAVAHHHENQPPPPPEHHHHGGALATAGALAAGAGLAHHFYQQHENQPPQPPEHHHYGEELAAAGALAGGVALAEHVHHEHQNQPPPQPPPEHHGGAAAAAAAGSLGVLLADQYLQQHSNPPPANLPAPPVDLNPAIPILPIPINNPSLAGAGYVGSGPNVQAANNGAALAAGAAGFAVGGAIAVAQNTHQQPQPPPPVLLQPVVLEPLPQPQSIPPPLPGPPDPFLDPPPPPQIFPQAGPSQFIPIAQASPTRPVPAVGVAGGPNAQAVLNGAGGRGDELSTVFPYAPADGMVITGIDSLFGRDPHRQ